MAKPSVELVSAIRRAAKKLEKNGKYQWGHMGSCNCGHLAQEITTLSQAEIHQYALRTRSGDWADQVSAFCPQSNLPMDLLISQMLDAGLSSDDLTHLERLSDPTVKASMGLNHSQSLKHNKKEDVVAYLHAWAKLLEAKVIDKISLPTFQAETKETVSA
jgi:hypothetical protein